MVGTLLSMTLIPGVLQSGSCLESIACRPERKHGEAPLVTPHVMFIVRFYVDVETRVLAPPPCSPTVGCGTCCNMLVSPHATAVGPLFRVLDDI